MIPCTCNHNETWHDNKGHCTYPGCSCAEYVPEPEDSEPDPIEED